MLISCRDLRVLIIFDGSKSYDEKLLSRAYGGIWYGHWRIPELIIIGQRDLNLDKRSLIDWLLFIFFQFFERYQLEGDCFLWQSLWMLILPNVVSKHLLPNIPSLYVLQREYKTPQYKRCPCTASFSVQACALHNIVSWHTNIDFLPMSLGNPMRIFQFAVTSMPPSCFVLLSIVIIILEVCKPTLTEVS